MALAREIFLQLDGVAAIAASEDRRAFHGMEAPARSFIETMGIGLTLTEKQRRAYLLRLNHGGERPLTDREGGRQLGMTGAAFHKLCERAVENVLALKRLVASANGDPRLVDDFLRRTILD